jgi:2-iminobutanoate/2-iminopropanoate deaminase
MARSSIYVGEIAHQSPIPNASRIGNIIVSGLIRGADPATAKLSRPAAPPSRTSSR